MLSAWGVGDAAPALARARLRRQGQSRPPLPGQRQPAGSASWQVLRRLPLPALWRHTPDHQARQRRAVPTAPVRHPMPRFYLIHTTAALACVAVLAAFRYDRDAVQFILSTHLALT